MENNNYQPIELHPGTTTYMPPVKKDNTPTLRIIIPAITLVSTVITYAISSLPALIISEFSHLFDTYERTFFQYFCTNLSGMITIIIELALIFATGFALTKNIRSCFKFMGCHAAGKIIGSIVYDILTTLFIAISMLTGNTDLSNLSFALSICVFIQLLASVAASAAFTYLATKNSINKNYI